MADRTLPGAITIRRATSEDAEIITQHRAAMFDDIRGPFPPEVMGAMNASFVDYVRRGLAEGTYLGWLACTEADEVVGGGGLILLEWMARPEDVDRRLAYIANVYTAPAYRRRGIARRIVETIIDWCRNREISFVSLHASEFGRPLYESLGFEPTNEMQLDLRQGDG